MDMLAKANVRVSSWLNGGRYRIRTYPTTVFTTTCGTRVAAKRPQWKPMEQLLDMDWTFPIRVVTGGSDSVPISPRVIFRLLLGNVAAEVVEQGFRAVVLPDHVQQASENEDPTKHVDVLT